MNKQEKYKVVFRAAREFLNSIVQDTPGLNKEILDRHLLSEAKFENIQDANRRLFESLANRNMMASVIGFSKREKELKKILFNFDAAKITESYHSPEELLEKFRQIFKLPRSFGARSLWRKFAEGIISGSVFMSTFNDRKDFDNFVQTFNKNKYTKAALPMLLSREIRGFGFALACDFLKELGYRDYPKPDVHLIKIFHDLELCDSVEPYEVYKNIIEMSGAVGEDAYTVDKVFWLISSGRFYLASIEAGRNREKFIKFAKAKIKEDQ